MKLTILHLVMVVQHVSASIAAAPEWSKRSTVAVTVDADQTYQSIQGFGFSEAFGFVNGLYQLPAAQQKYGLDLLFNLTTGAGLNIVRNRIGSTSSDTIEPTSPGLPSLPPHYVPPPNNDSNQLTFAKQAQAYGVTTFIADAWSAPGFMKTNGEETEGGYLCGVTGESCTSGDWRQAYANYIVKYLQDYIAAGVNYSYVGFLNEPQYTGSYSSMLSNGTQAASFITVLAPTMRAAGLSSIGIYCCDGIGWQEQKTMTAQIEAAGVIDELALITSHSYTDGPNGPINTTLPVWQTEYCDLRGSNVSQWYINGGAGEGLTWANHIYTAIVLSNVSAYLHWIGIQSGVSDSALVYIENNQAIPTGRLWAFGQWSRYVRPRAVRLATVGSTATLLTSAFRNPAGWISVQLINNGNAAQMVAVTTSGFNFGSVAAKVSSNANNNISPLAVTITAGKVVVDVPAFAMGTIIMLPA